MKPVAQIGFKSISISFSARARRSYLQGESFSKFQAFTRLSAKNIPSKYKNTLKSQKVK
jgi:hypothetical protein